MQKRICPKCLTRWYSADSSRDWKCGSCGHSIPVPKENEGVIKLYQIFICGEIGWVTENPHNFEDEIEEYTRECNKNISFNKTMEKIEKLNVGEEIEVEELKFKCIEMGLEEYSNLGEWGGW